MRVYETPQRTPQRERRLRAMHAKGCSDAEIAAKLGMIRETLGGWRRALGLPSNRFSEHQRARVRAKTKQQLAACGCRNLAEVRAKRYREFAVERGWPEDLRVRQVQILDALYDLGPMTREAICDAIGYFKLPSQRKWLFSKYCKGGTYLTDLMHRGLVVKLAGRVVKGGVNKRGDGSGKCYYLYALPLHVKRGNVHANG